MLIVSTTPHGNQIVFFKQARHFLLIPCLLFNAEDVGINDVHNGRESFCGDQPLQRDRAISFSSSSTTKILMDIFHVVLGVHNPPEKHR